MSALDELLSAVKCASQQIFTAEEIQALTRPCVYLFLRGDEVLYVGRSYRGILRPFSPTHHRQPLKPDRVKILWFSGHWQADRVEQILISTLRPVANQKVKSCGLFSIGE